MIESPPPRRYEYEPTVPQIYRVRSRRSGPSPISPRFPRTREKVAVRMIHASGQTDLARDLAIHPDLVSAARAALAAGRA